MNGLGIDDKSKLIYTMAKLTLHPLIHTFLNFNLAQNGVGGQICEVQERKPPSARCTKADGSEREKDDYEMTNLLASHIH